MVQLIMMYVIEMCGMSLYQHVVSRNVLGWISCYVIRFVSCTGYVFGIAY